MELLDICLILRYFKLEDKFYQQKSGIAMGGALSVVVYICGTL
jgi:hypothetical protein